ncbi:hypothetical protein [Caballeronia sp. J97]|uniref:hypothetical protein n=1 Tax=Caballeronia sp. J97 TaxID=2805429 RepID=UPI002AB0F0B1|nr:hypothetical protein [Caballeronia sp. J97]
MNSRREMLKACAAAGFTAILHGCDGASARPSENTSPPFPDIADTTGASAELVQFMKGFFTAKSNHNVEQTMSFFAPNMITYIDAILGWDLAGFAAVESLFQKYMPTWPAAARSYPTRIIGDLNSGATVCFTDTPELFGGEIRAIGIIDFSQGKIARWIDHWDFNSYSNQYGLQRATLTGYRQDQVSESASTVLLALATKLCSALSLGDVTAVASMFSDDAVFEDMALRLQILGRIEIQRYLSRTISLLPYGAGMSLRHVVGGAAGGGFEWNGGSISAVRTGATSLLLDSNDHISRLTSVYDGSLLSSGTRSTLLAASVD